MTDSSTTPPEYLKRYAPDDDGLRFQSLEYTGNFKDLPPVPDGILGDKLMKSRAKTRILERLTNEDVLRDRFTVAELNDLNNYLAWHIWDMLVMRATEGVSGMIPRQEYEILAFMQFFFRYPELMRRMTDCLGSNGVIELGASARREIGTKLNCLHNWAVGVACFGMGRTTLLATGRIGAHEYVEESVIILKFMQRLLWGMRQDGWIFSSQDRYRCQMHDPDFLAGLMRESIDFEPGSPDQEVLTRFNATAELLAFLEHYDCRLGLGDAGPYQLPDGRILIVRDLFVNEEAYYWSEASEDLPYAYTLLLFIDPAAMGLREIRVNDICTTFTAPKNYLPYITGGAVFVRDKWNTPMEQVYPVKLHDLAPQIEKISSATFRLYNQIARMSRHTHILNGICTYYVGCLLPHMRASGLYDEFCRRYDLWEIDQRVMNSYYGVTKRGFAQVTIPQKIFSGEGYLPFPDSADVRASKYLWA